METTKRNQPLKDIFGILFFIIAVIIGAWLINSLVFRSFSVLGPSMEPTMYTNDRLIVNRVPVTFDAIQGDDYVPKRGHVIVFKNPRFDSAGRDEYIVKRVIGYPGERVVVKNGVARVFKPASAEAIDPYQDANIEPTPVTGKVDEVVPEGEIFVIGDNHSGNDSLDSRNGLGTVPYSDIVGPVAFRIFPFDKVSADF